MDRTQSVDGTGPTWKLQGEFSVTWMVLGFAASRPLYVSVLLRVGPGAVGSPHRVPEGEGLWEDKAP